MFSYSVETSIIKATPSITPSDHNTRTHAYCMVHLANKSVYTLHICRVKRKMLAALRTQHQNKREIVLCIPVYCHIACCEKYLCFVSVTTRFLCVFNYVRSFSVLEILRVAVVVGICQALCLVFSFTNTPHHISRYKKYPHERKQNASSAVNGYSRLGLSLHEMEISLDIVLVHCNTIATVLFYNVAEEKHYTKIPVVSDHIRMSTMKNELYRNNEPII